APAPVHHMGHLYWASSIDAYKRLSAAYLREQAERAALGSDAAVAPAAPAFPAPAQARWLDRHRVRSMLRGVAQRIYARLFGSLPTVTPNHPYWPDLHVASAKIREACARPDAKVLIVKSQQNVFKKLVDGARV